MEEQKRGSNAWGTIIILILFAVPIFVFFPFVVLGLGQAFDFITPNAAKHQAQNYLEKKYKEDFVIESMREGNQNGIYEGKAFVDGTSLVLNLGGWKSSTTKELYIQDDYTLQLLLDEWIKEFFKDQKAIFKASYNYPSMFMEIYGGKTDWTDLLKNREGIENITINLDVFVDRNIDSSLEKSMRNLKTKIEQEHIEVSIFTLNEIKEKDFNKDFLLLEQEKQNKKIVKLVYFDE